jgi:hypothetical protein
VLAPVDVLGRRLVPFRVVVRVGRDRPCLCRRGCQSCQTYQRWNDHSHLSPLSWGNNAAVLTKAEQLGTSGLPWNALPI